MKSKKWVVVRLLTVIATLVFVFYAFIYWSNYQFMRILYLLVLAIPLIIHLIAMYCPHCGAIGKLRCNLLSKKYCGRCKKCGELVYWKEYGDTDS